MAYDEALAQRIRDLLASEPDLTEQRMFGGLAFLLAGNMAVCATHVGGVLVRVGPADRDRLLASTATAPMEMGGRTMRGFLRVDAAHVRTDDELAAWVQRGAAHARTLPPKQPPE
ncbi:MAG TPA: TfoX/Sxy family protein [Pseudonocardia sp.]|uniref:TfoX/Sxy family protein n=1 Tax=Pseudonocardia sp. TaxID=60912 RepID=UPI002B4B1F63|nr:TfoX/Sxy family protein [Pseudonocardia sp.]HLU57913.1 TfoX/Sxy family protein [Pseudonocardia sp.]